MTTSCDRSEGGKRDRISYRYNPFEIAVWGPFGPERGALAAHLAFHLSSQYRVGQVLERDSGMHPDSVELMGVTLIRGDGQHGYMYPEAMDAMVKPHALLDVDLLIVETEEDLPMAKVVLMGDGSAPDLSQVLCYAAPKEACPILPPTANFFVTDDSVAIASYVSEYLYKCADETPLLGLVLAGGLSTRMQRDKATLVYHGKPQAIHTAELLRRFCDDVFLSSRPDQADDPVLAELPQIHDRFVGFGPLGGILSAMKEYPTAAWLVAACDLPFMTEATLQTLLEARNPYKLATAFRSARDGFPEPLCAIYEPKSIFRLLHFLAMGYHCPRKVLINSDTNLIEPVNETELANINYPEEYKAAVETIVGRQEDIS
ncbi:MAG: NTP transferase domain-containing protein [Candidatus Hydrogenedentales bacterium]